MEGIDLTRYLESFARSELPVGEPKPGRRPFVTISRQAGAGGRTLAYALAAALERETEPLWRDWKIFDQELCRKVAEDETLRVSLESLLSEDYLTPMGDFMAQLVAGASPQEAVVRRVFKTIRTLACAGKAILVGRAGCLVTKGLPAGVHVRLVAPLEWRVRRVERQLGLVREEARREARRQDESRALLFRARFHRDIDDPLLYDAVFDAERACFDEIAAAVVALVKARAAKISAEAPPGLVGAGG